jgi:hypothetical protein
LYPLQDKKARLPKTALPEIVMRKVPDIRMETRINRNPGRHRKPILAGWKQINAINEKNHRSLPQFLWRRRNMYLHAEMARWISTRRRRLTYNMNEINSGMFKKAIWVMEIDMWKAHHRALSEINANR